MKFNFLHSVLFEHKMPLQSHLAEPSFEDVAKDWNIPPRDQSGDVSWFVKNTDLKGKHVWVARPSEPKERALLDLLNETCQDMGIKRVPKLLIYADYIPNAASEGFTGEVMISTNLADIMSRGELKAVLGHELAHHKARVKDLAFMGLNLAFWSASFIGAKQLINKYVDTYKTISTDPLTRVQKHPWIKRTALRGTNISLTVFGFVASLAGLGFVQKWYQRKAESKADLVGANVAGTQAMVDSLTVLDNRAGEILAEKVPYGEARNPDEAKTRELDHPKVNDRIQNILKNAPNGHNEKRQREGAPNDNKEQFGRAGV